MTNTDKQYFTHSEIAEDIKNTLENGYTGYYSELHNEAFSTGYYIVGTFEATKALEQYGTFKAIDVVRKYEKEKFGDFTTEIEPEKIANRLYYILGSDFLYNEFNFTAELDLAEEKFNLSDLWDSEATPEVNQYLIEQLNDYLS